MNKLKWRRLGKNNIPDIYEQLKSDINNAKNINDIKIYVGSDSQKKQSHINYVSTIVVYTDNHGGAVYYTKSKEKHTSMTNRLWNEVYKSVGIAIELNKFLEQYNLEVHEIHADLNSNPKFKSNKIVGACLGYIQGMGFNGAIKPDAWAASKIANINTK